MEKRCVRLEHGMAMDADTAPWQQKRADCLRDAAALEALDRALVSLLIERIVVYPPGPPEPPDEAKTRRIDIVWRF